MCAQCIFADCKLSHGRKKPKCHSCSCYWQLFSYHQREFIAPLTDAEIQKLELKAKGIESENRNAKKKKKRKSPTKTSHFTAHIAHASLHGERKREPEPPTTDVRRSVSGTSGSCLGSMLRSAVQDTTENFTTKILADTAHGRCISREEGLKTKLS